MKVGDLVRKKRTGYFPGYSKAEERGEKPDIGVVVEVKKTRICVALRGTLLIKHAAIFK
jgi:hypothetical protein